MSVTEPAKIITPWAEKGLKNPIPPSANPATGRAGFDQGFSAINMTAKEAGGIPPYGQDFNGIFYDITNILRYMQAGGQPTFSSDLATAIGGYPKGSVILGGDGLTLWQSNIASNFTEPGSENLSWSEIDVGLKYLLSLPSGAGLIGGLMTPITAKYLSGGAVSGEDSTKAIQAAGMIGGTYYVPKGEYLISSALITKNITFVFEEGASFKRMPGLDIHQSYWNAGVPMIDAAADGLTITFMDPVFDGNNKNQPAVQVGYSGPNATTEPAGWAFRYYPIDPSTAKNCRFNFVRPKFINGTAGYILARGDDVSRRFKTEIFLDTPVFTDTIYGYGKGDPATPSALGYSPDYIQVVDYVTVNGLDVEMSYSSVPTPTGRYAPVGIRATYLGGGTPSASGGPTINLFGQTNIKGLGRKGNYYDESSFLNNGIGAIDGYGNADSIYVENIIAEDCEAQPVRAKASISRYEVATAKFNNCRGGTQVSPSTTGETEAVVVIGTVEATGGWNPAVEIVGTDGAQLIPSVSIGTVNCSGGINGDGRSDNTVSGIFVRYCDEVYAENLIAKNQDKSGIQFRDNQFVTVNSYRAENTSLEGFTSVSTARSLVVSSGQSKKCGGTGLTVSGSTYNVKVSDVYTDGTTDYGIFINTPAENCEIDHCTAREISGLSRAFHMAATGTVSNSKIGSGVTTPVSGNLFIINQINNSWSPRSDLINAGAGAPTLGEFRKGDRIYSAPAPGGYIGWVCTTAGAAGSTAVFKRFGAIEG